ncbi:unnamed protein product [Rotaria sordida]|uniref:acylglycerol lipase n=1 Tax=Rotaria sordida TaxID=392033 RepID=A0A815H7X7_9BILA|nr:unnamed protein product [Rotaria sordida]
MRRAGVKKRFLLIGDDNNEGATFCYYEKGSKVPHEPSFIFIHGFSSDKYAWLGVIKEIPYGFHCIAIDLPGHGESVGFNEEQLIAVNVFFDKLNLTEPIYLVGCSMGGSIAAMFATKYPSYVCMICLLAPVPPGEEYETELLSQLRSGVYHIVLPETLKQFYAAAKLLSMKKVHANRLLARIYLKSRLSMLDQHKKVLKSAFENDYPNLEQSYAELKNLACSVLIIWGRQDQLCSVDGANYFSNLIPDAKLIFFDDCGHLITTDKPTQTASIIIKFWETPSTYRTNLYN